METTTIPDEERGVMRDVSWEFYDRLSDAIGEQSHIRVAYDGKDLEIMNLGPKHERSKSRLGFFIYEVAMGLEIEFEPFDSTTWKRFPEQVGLESDLCYYFDQAKFKTLDEKVESNDVRDYPDNPDLAVEVDISPSKIDRQKIYAALKASKSGCSRTASFPSNSSDRTGSIARRRRAGSCPSEPMRSPDGSPIGNPAGWGIGDGASRSGFGPSRRPGSTVPRLPGGRNGDANPDTGRRGRLGGARRKCVHRLIARPSIGIASASRGTRSRTSALDPDSPPAERGNEVSRSRKREGWIVDPVTPLKPPLLKYSLTARSVGVDREDAEPMIRGVQYVLTTGDCPPDIWRAIVCAW